MDNNSFWLVSIDDDKVLVALVTPNISGIPDLNIGTLLPWSSSVENSLVQSTDESLSSASLLAAIEENQEPTKAAFILPPLWVGDDGKIIANKLKTIEPLHEELKLKPMGFIANDEAIAEEANLRDSFPASFILVHVEESSYTLSLVYLGKIKHRLKNPLNSTFSPAILENSLLALNSESTLPPQVILYGNLTDSIVDEFRSFPWTGKKNIETFLHFPEINYYTGKQIIEIFAKTIISQIRPSSIKADVEENLAPQAEPEPEMPPEPEPPQDNPSVLEEVSASDLGFSLPLPHQEVIAPEPEVEKIISPSVKSSFKFKIPQIHLKLPKISLNSSIPLFLLALSPLLVALFVYLSSAKISLFVTPYSFSKSAPVILDSAVKQSDVSKHIFPVINKTFDITASATVTTTGKKTVGEKARGDIIIFNKLDKSQDLPKSTVLTDLSGKKYQLLNSVTIASSSSDLQAGVITLGRTKATIEAADIGPEYNIAKDTKLTFKDYSETNFIARVDSSLVGGSRQDINAVSAQDKTSLESKVEQTLKANLDKKLNQELKDQKGVIQESFNIKNRQLEYSREVGEQADELSVTITAAVSIFTMDDTFKNEILTYVLASDENFNKSIIDPASFSLSFKINKNDGVKADTVLTVTGNALPKIDVNLLKTKISGKNINQASKIINDLVDHMYNFKIETNYSYLPSFIPLPYRLNKITVDIKEK